MGWLPLQIFFLFRLFSEINIEGSGETDWERITSTSRGALRLDWYFNNPVEQLGDELIKTPSFPICLIHERIKNWAALSRATTERGPPWWARGEWLMREKHCECAWLRESVGEAVEAETAGNTWCLTRGVLLLQAPRLIHRQRPQALAPSVLSWVSQHPQLGVPPQPPIHEQKFFFTKLLPLDPLISTGRSSWRKRRKVKLLLCVTETMCLSVELHQPIFNPALLVWLHVHTTDN